MVGAAPSAEDEACLGESHRLMADAVAELPGDLRDVYALWSTGEWSLDALATEFDVARGVMRGRVERIKRHLAERVDADTALAIGLLHPENAQ